MPCTRPVHPGQPERGLRHFTLGPEVWIEREDFMEEPLKGYFRLSPPRFDGKGAQIAGSVVRLKYGYIIQCTGCKKNSTATSPRCRPRWCPTRRSGTPGADAVKIKGVITWVGGARRAARRGAAVRPAVHRSPARRRRARLQGHA